MAQIIIQEKQTLSGIASQFGTTVEELQQLNPSSTGLPDPTNPNLILEGKNLIVPDTQEPTLIDTEGFRVDAQADRERLDEMTLQTEESQRLLAEGAERPQEGDRRVFAGQEQVFVNGNWQRLDLAPSRVTGEKAEPKVPITPELAPEEQAEQTRLEEARIELSTQQAEIDRSLDQLSIQADANTTLLIQQIKNRFDQRRREQEDINRRSQAALQQLGIRTGAARRAGSFVGIVSAEERTGIDRLTNLDRQESELILAAKEALRTEKFDILSEKMDAIEKKREQIDKEIAKFNEAVLKRNEELNKRNKRILRENAIIGLISEGITEPDDIFRLLEGDATLEEIDDAMGIILEDEDNKFATGAVGQFQVAKAEALIPKDMTFFDFLRAEAIARKVPDVGVRGRDDLSALERLAAGRLAVEHFGKRRAQDWTPLIEDLIAKGMTIDDVGDELRLLSESAEFTGAWRNAAENISLVGGFTGEKRDNLFNTIDRNLAEGNVELAKESIVSGILSTLGAVEVKKFNGIRRGMKLLDEISNDLKEYELGGGDTNIFTGTTEKMLEKAGGLINPDLARIGNKIAIAIQRYRQDLTGAAFTESEAKEYRAIFPSLNNISLLNSAKMEALRGVWQGDVEAVISNVVGFTTFDELFGGTSDATGNIGLGALGGNEETNAVVDDYLESIGRGNE